MVHGMRQVHRVKKKRRTLTPVLLILNLLLWGSSIYLWWQDYEPAPTVTGKFAYSQIIETSPIEVMNFNNSHVVSYDELDFVIYSDYALLINLTAGDMLFAYNENERVYPASLTKIMTVLIGLEYAGVDDDLIVRADFNELHHAGAAMADFVYGETRTLSEVLHGAMLPSGADATTTLAYHIADSYEAFVDLMNETALRLGMFDTHFTNASGLHDDNHYTTAYDVALMLEYALQIEEFRLIFTAPTYTFTTLMGNEHTMRSTMFNSLVASGNTPEFTGGEFLGGKDGFTFPAGLCLASLATDGVDEFILITLRAPYGTGNYPHVVDAVTIYEHFLNVE